MAGSGRPRSGPILALTPGSGFLPGMLRLLQTTLGRLRLIGFCEGASFLLLLGVAMPLKYLAGRPEAVRIAGMAHGVLFLLYVATAIQATGEYGWPRKTAIKLVVAALLPFGPFYADAKLLRPVA
jgi:integral membrane protein